MMSYQCKQRLKSIIHNNKYNVLINNLNNRNVIVMWKIEKSWALGRGFRVLGLRKISGFQ